MYKHNYIERQKNNNFIVPRAKSNKKQNKKKKPKNIAAGGLALKQKLPSYGFFFKISYDIFDETNLSRIGGAYDGFTFCMSLISFFNCTYVTSNLRF